MKKRAENALAVEIDPPRAKTVRELQEILRRLAGSPVRIVKIGQKPAWEAYNIILARCLRLCGEISPIAIGKLVGEVSEQFKLKPFIVYSMSLTEFAANLTQGETPVQDDTAAVDHPQVKWPPDNKWHFRHGEAAFLGVRFPIKGKAAMVLEFLARARRGVTAKEIGDVSSPNYEIEDATVRGYLSDVRSLLRDNFNVSGDPIPKVDSGSKSAWKLDCAVLSQRISNAGSDK